MIKKTFFAAFFLVFCVNAFSLDLSDADIALDNGIYLQKLGNASRENFLYDVSSIDGEVFDMFQSAGIHMEEFAEITPDVMDDEDKAVVEKLTGLIKLSAKKNDELGSMIVRSFDESSGEVDGWIGFSHFLSEDDIKTYLYYFSMRKPKNSGFGR